jgi:hypothetical protein
MDPPAEFVEILFVIFIAGGKKQGFPKGFFYPGADHVFQNGNTFLLEVFPACLQEKIPDPFPAHTGEESAPFSGAVPGKECFPRNDTFQNVTHGTVGSTGGSQNIIPGEDMEDHITAAPLEKMTVFDIVGSIFMQDYISAEFPSPEQNTSGSEIRFFSSVPDPGEEDPDLFMIRSIQFCSGFKAFPKGMKKSLQKQIPASLQKKRMCFLFGFHLKIL